MTNVISIENKQQLFINELTLTNVSKVKTDDLFVLIPTIHDDKYFDFMARPEEFRFLYNIHHNKVVEISVCMDTMHIYEKVYDIVDGKIDRSTITNTDTITEELTISKISFTYNGNYIVPLERILESTYFKAFDDTIKNSLTEYEYNEKDGLIYCNDPSMFGNTSNQQIVNIYNSMGEDKLVPLPFSCKAISLHDYRILSVDEINTMIFDNFKNSTLRTADGYHLLLITSDITNDVIILSDISTTTSGIPIIINKTLTKVVSINDGKYTLDELINIVKYMI